MNKIDEKVFMDLNIFLSMKAENRIPLFKPPYPKVLYLNYIEVVKREFT